MSNLNWIIILLTVAVMFLLLTIWGGSLQSRVEKLEFRVNALQTLQQERLDAFSKDVYNMTGVMELLEEQALLLQVIERRTR